MRNFWISVTVGLFASCLGWAQQSLGPSTPSSPTPMITLQDVLQRVKANSVQFLAAQAESALAKEDRVQARAALLPNVS